MEQASERRIAGSAAGKQEFGMGMPLGCTPRKAEQQHLAGKADQVRTPGCFPCIVHRVLGSVRGGHLVAVHRAC